MISKHVTGRLKPSKAVAHELLTLRTTSESTTISEFYINTFTYQKKKKYGIDTPLMKTLIAGVCDCKHLPSVCSTGWHGGVHHIHISGWNKFLAKLRGQD